MYIKPFVFLSICLFLTSCAQFVHFGSSDNAKQQGIKYLLGRGVKKDDALAFYYFKKAASYNDPFAENELAYLYAAGKGTHQDYVKSRYYYEKAANRGIASAQYNLGLLYERGLGGSKDYQKAQFWYKQSAENGFLPAKNMLIRDRK